MNAPSLVLFAPLPADAEWETAGARDLDLLLISDRCPPERAAFLAGKYAPEAIWVGLADGSARDLITADRHPLSVNKAARECDHGWPSAAAISSAAAQPLVAFHHQQRSVPT